MITTVTTSTISTISTVTTMVGFGATLGLIAVVALTMFLCARQIAAAGNSTTQRILARSFDVSIAPLLIAFVIIVVMKVAEILG